MYRRIDRLRELLIGHVAATRSDPRLDSRTDVLALLMRGGGSPTSTSATSS